MSPRLRHIARRTLVNELVTPRFGCKIKLKTTGSKPTAHKT
jgi:hypothetical protein